MKKLMPIDEYGRGKAEERYGKPESQSKHGQMGMSQNIRGKFQMARGGPAPGKQRNILVDSDPVGPPGETDMDFSQMDDENAAVRKGK